MKRDNKVFFVSLEQSKKQDRPCGYYMRDEYRKWACLAKK